MRDDESCRYVESLIIKYINGDCTKAESGLLEEHCANCGECSMKLMQAVKQHKRTSTKEVFYLTRVKEPNSFEKSEIERAVQNEADSLYPVQVEDNGLKSEKSKEYIERGEKKNINILAFLGAISAALLLIVVLSLSIPKKIVLNKRSAETSTNVPVEKNNNPNVINTEDTFSDETSFVYVTPLPVENGKKEFDTAKDTSSTTTEPEINDFVIDWKDSELEKKVRMITGISSGDIMYSDVYDITSLDLSTSINDFK